MGIMADMGEIRSPEELKSEIEGRDKKPAVDSDPRLEEDFAFDISWTDPKGHVWKGSFTNRILDFTTTARVGSLQSRLSGGVPIESLSDYMASHTEKLAHCTFSLVKRPKWANELGTLRYTRLLDLIYEGVALHEATFSGRFAPEETGASGDGDDQGATEEVG